VWTWRYFPSTGGPVWSFNYWQKCFFLSKQIEFFFLNSSAPFIPVSQNSIVTANMVRWKKLIGLGNDRNDFRDEMRRRECH